MSNCDSGNEDCEAKINTTADAAIEAAPRFPKLQKKTKAYFDVYLTFDYCPLWKVIKKFIFR